MWNMDQIEYQFEDQIFSGNEYETGYGKDVVKLLDRYANNNKVSDSEYQTIVVKLLKALRRRDPKPLRSRYDRSVYYKLVDLIEKGGANEVRERERTIQDILYWEIVSFSLTLGRKGEL